MSDVIQIKKIRCFFCNREIEWAFELVECPFCDGKGCFHCDWSGYVMDSDILPCCDECYEREYGDEGQ